MAMKRKAMMILGILSVALLLTLAGGTALRLAQDTVLAQTSAHYDLSWHVLSGGGREGMTSGSHTVHGTLGQLAIGPGTGSQTLVGSGYWCGVQQAAGGSAPGPEGYQVYLPIVLKAY
jgi:type II secretory pathway pseudopilin PulG